MNIYNIALHWLKTNFMINRIMIAVALIIRNDWKRSCRQKVPVISIQSNYRSS